jgi:hypothetical protein
MYCLVAKVEGKDHLGELDVDERIILNKVVSFSC